jgi:hypothetical protein
VKKLCKSERVRPGNRESPGGDKQILGGLILTVHVRDAATDGGFGVHVQNRRALSHLLQRALHPDHLSITSQHSPLLHTQAALYIYINTHPERISTLSCSSALKNERHTGRLLKLSESSGKRTRWRRFQRKRNKKTNYNARRSSPSDNSTDRFHLYKTMDIQIFFFFLVVFFTPILVDIYIYYRWRRVFFFSVLCLRPVCVKKRCFFFPILVVLVTIENGDFMGVDQNYC